MDAAVDETHVPAGFWLRLAASLIDALVFVVVGVVLTTVGISSGPGNLISLVLSAGYFTFFHGRTGQTPGNAAMSIRVLDPGTGEPIGYARALRRWIVSILSGIPLLLGYLWMLWDPKQQTWHDKAAGSLPVRVRRAW
jgi:uncharacterized RDD family membrane protein YckC